MVWGDFFYQFTRCFLFPCGHHLRLYRSSGILSSGGVDPEVIRHLEGKKAWKLEGSQSSEARLTTMKILGWPLGERTRDFLIERPPWLLRLEKAANLQQS